MTYHSVAWPYAPAMPHHLGKAVSEDLVRRSGLDWTILEPCAYAQNLLPGLAGETPAVRVPYALDTPFGLVDLDDVGEATAAVLTERGHTGATYELGGPSLVTVRGVARTAAEVLGREVPAERLDPEVWVRGPGSEVPERERAWLLAMFASYDRYGLPAASASLRAVLGREPRGVEAVLRREIGP